MYIHTFVVVAEMKLLLVVLQLHSKLVDSAVAVYSSSQRQCQSCMRLSTATNQILCGQMAMLALITTGTALAFLLGSTMTGAT